MVYDHFSKEIFFQLKIAGLSTQWSMLLSYIWIIKYVFVSLLNRHITGCPSCDNIPDIECSLVSMVNVISFFESKIFTHGFFAMITFNLLKAFCYSSDHSFFLNLQTAQSSPCILVHIACRNSPIPKRIQVFLLSFFFYISF